MSTIFDDPRKLGCCGDCLLYLKEYGKQLTSLQYWPNCSLIEKADFEAYLAGELRNVYDREKGRWYWQTREGVWLKRDWRPGNR